MSLLSLTLWTIGLSAFALFSFMLTVFVGASSTEGRIQASRAIDRLLQSAYFLVLPGCFVASWILHFSALSALEALPLQIAGAVAVIVPAVVIKIVTARRKP